MDMEDQVDVWYQNRIHMAVSFTNVHVAKTHELAAPIVTLGLWSNDWDSPQDGGGFSAIAASSNKKLNRTCWDIRRFEVSAFDSGCAMIYLITSWPAGRLALCYTRYS